MNRYIEAGADIVFADALIDEAMFRAVTQQVNAPFMANMTEFGRTPYYTAGATRGVWLQVSDLASVFFTGGCQSDGETLRRSGRPRCHLSLAG